MKILLVDDSRSARDLTAAYLMDMGYPALEACDADTALEIYNREAPDLVLSDVEMPGKNGYELAREIRRHDRNDDWTPIIFLSARVSDDDIATGLEAGGDDYITKPVSPVVLRAKLMAMQRITGLRKRAVDLSRQLQQVNKSLMRLSSVDSLTNLANRRSFDSTLELEWQRGSRSGKPLALLIGDVDFFKRYNDHYGHQQGDVCLQAAAGALGRCVTDGDALAARIGGEEFALLLPNTDIDAAVAVGEHVLDAIRTLNLPHAASEVAARVTMSLGATVCFPGGGCSALEFFKRADAALYQAKGSGRDRCMAYTAAAVSAQ